MIIVWVAVTAHDTGTMREGAWGSQDRSLYDAVYVMTTAKESQ